MINQQMVTALNEQVNAELWSGYLYLSISYNMSSKGFHGVSNWFSAQSHEKFEHAIRIAKYIVSRDAKVSMKPIAEVCREWNSPVEAFEYTLSYEKAVTETIRKLMDKATELKDYKTQDMLQWFIDEQAEEENTTRQLLRTLKMVEKDSAAQCFCQKVS